MSPRSLKNKFLCCAALALVYFGFAFLLAAAEKPSVYVWQRAWTPEVCEAIQQLAGEFTKLIALKTEIGWKGSSPTVVHVPVQYDCLRSNRCAVGLALRIGAFSGSFTKTNESTQLILREISMLLADAKSNHLDVAELQIDFDCAESKLSGYRLWVEAIRARFPEVPLSITALPTWLNHADFNALAHAAGAYVLQVHSFERPKNFDTPFTLCDPAKARAAVQKASAIGVPFQVALPTYSYTVAFSAKGTFVGLSAEGRPQSWPADVKTKEVRANAQELTGLLQEWIWNPPMNFHGVIWYRLPVPGDRLNWKWETLNAVMHGRTPKAQLDVTIKKPEPQLVEIRLRNSGNDDASVPLAIDLRWKKSRLIASDALRDFDLIDSTSERAQFRRRQFLPPLILKPGDECFVGWLRFTQETEVQCELISK
ncbi:MAG: hypothetical protein JWM68_4649 [Verrucomicrobiales bacterium]|nr:hypothetical protein [Verrucomicrobiales bacterium]